MEKYFKYVIIILAILQVISLSKCNNYKKETSTYKDLYVNGKQEFENFKTSTGKVIQKQKAIQTEDKKIVEDLLHEIDFLKKKKRTIRTVVKTETVFKLDSVFVPFADTSSKTVLIDGVQTPIIIPPKLFLNKTPHYTIGGTVLFEGIQFDSLEFKNTSTLAIQEKGGIMNKRNIVYINNSNPYFKTVGMNSVVTKKRPTKFNISLKIGLGFSAGYLVGRLSN